MKIRVKRSAMGLSLVALLGSGLLLAGCGDQAASVSATDQAAAKQQFLGTRSADSTPGTASGTPGTAGFGGRAPGVFGSIVSVSGNKITIKSQLDGADTVVQLGDGAPVLKQATAQLSDIKEGETVTATGTKNGDVVEAQVVQIGNAGLGGFGGGRGFGGGAGGGFNGTPGAGGRFGGFNGTPGTGRQRGANGTPGPNAAGTPGVPRSFVSGTVTKVDGNTVTVNMANNTVSTFTVTSTTRLQNEVKIQIGDLKTGDNIVAAGQQNGDVFDATSIQVVTGTGFGGGLGGPGRGTRGQATPTP